MTSRIADMFTQALQSHLALFAALPQLGAGFQSAADMCIGALRRDGTILLCGNGGSAADAQHAAAELTGRYKRDRKALRAIALTTDTSALTAIGNDYGFDQVFSRQVEALGRPGDVLIAISTSGNSPNVMKAVEAARAGGLSVIGLAGRDGGALALASDVALVVPSPATERIQEGHIFLIHCLCAAIEEAVPA